MAEHDSQKLLDLFVHAPLGMLSEFSELYPEAVKRGRSQVNLGTTAAKVAANAKRQEMGSVSEEFLAEAASFLRIIASRLDDLAESNSASEPSAPVAGYEKMTAREVVKLVAESDSKLVAEIGKYEADNKARKSVLAAVKAAK